VEADIRALFAESIRVKEVFLAEHTAAVAEAARLIARTLTAGGKLLLFRVDGATLTKVAEAPIGHWSQGVAFSGDGKTILVQNMVEKEIWIFAVDGTALRDTGQRIKVNGGPAAIRIADKPR